MLVLYANEAEIWVYRPRELVPKGVLEEIGLNFIEWQFIKDLLRCSNVIVP